MRRNLSLETWLLLAGTAGTAGLGVTLLRFSVGGFERSTPDLSQLATGALMVAVGASLLLRLAMRNEPVWQWLLVAAVPSLMVIGGAVWVTYPTPMVKIHNETEAPLTVVMSSREYTCFGLIGAGPEGRWVDKARVRVEPGERVEVPKPGSGGIFRCSQQRFRAFDDAGDLVWERAKADIDLADYSIVRIDRLP